MSEKFKAFLTGKMFIKRDPKLKHGGSLQLEAVIEGERTRLYGESLPDDCLYDKRHKLEIRSIFETHPLTYEIVCSCGKKTGMQDINEDYKRLG
ncbi:hypothetical protein J4408_02965 [Candidatus Pacearchaeota archaeon]|nr:hypothetical protein [Candidatus Pacearchaeota archaeon]